ncbi:uncharacterized protein LOC142620360 [Castanea sativa]|uniref:uncharacterized protein LOC142620360 n=1 Tax=Castanea sativa TaxID=21020 RepID=UPI003F652942
MEILQAYEIAFGQKINSDKSFTFFSSNTPHPLREEIKQFFNANSNVPLEKYLGLPPIIGRGKKQAFEDIKSKVQSKLEGWKGKLLSQAGREILIKLVALAIPVYAMNYFLLPLGLCDDINSMMGKFWWGQKNEETKIHWLIWKHMCLAKKDGASLIKAIPFSPRRPEDSLVWTRNKNGAFSVRSAYFLQFEIERKSTGNEASSSNPAYLHSFWNGIWSAQVPPKIKTFFWRACNDSLPTRTKLFERKVLHSFSCVLCNEKAKTCDYLFLECSFAQAVWLQSPLLNDYRHYSKMKFIDAINAALKKLSAFVFDTLCIACWMIWKCRNKAVFNNIAPSYHELWTRADLYRLEFMEVQQKNLQESIGKAIRWSPPQSDCMYKLNVAFSQSKKSSSIGIGFIIRNYVGEVLAAVCDKSVKELNPLCTAACVVRKALLVCQSTSFSHVQVECNFAELVDLLNSDHICSLEVAWILEDIAIINDNFNLISFSSIPLRCNRAVLALTNAAKEKRGGIGFELRLSVWGSFS